MHQAALLQFKAALDQIVTVPDAIWQDVSTQLPVQVLRRGEYLLKAGQIENRTTFLCQGALRQYYIKDDKEVNKEIYLNCEFVSSYRSFLTRTPSRYSIQALEDCTLILFEYDLVRALYARYHVIERLGRLIAEQKYLLKEYKEELLLLDSAEERYTKLLAEKPQFLQRVPLYHVASYLGIAPETLSRVRSATSSQPKNS